MTRTAIRHACVSMVIILTVAVVHLSKIHSIKYVVLTPENESKIIEFDLYDLDIEKLEVTISARLVPYSYWPDYCGSLAVEVNDNLPIAGDFGLPSIVAESFKKEDSAFRDVLEKLLWYAPSYYKASMGLSGSRTVWFDKTVLNHGSNRLSIIRYDETPGFSLGNAFIIKDIMIRSYNKQRAELVLSSFAF